MRRPQVRGRRKAFNILNAFQYRPCKTHRLYSTPFDTIRLTSGPPAGRGTKSRTLPHMGPLAQPTTKRRKDNEEKAFQREN